MTLISLIKEFDCVSEVNLLVHTAVSGLVDSYGCLIYRFDVVGVVALVMLLGGSTQDFWYCVFDWLISIFLRIFKSSLASLLGFLAKYPDLGLPFLGLTSPVLLLASTFEQDIDLTLARITSFLDLFILYACDGDYIRYY